jgi:hypothetical protein
VSGKTLVRIVDTPPPHWVGDGFFVRPLFADLAFTNAISPFLMLDYAAPVEFKPTARPPGVGPHPHAGFETVTIVYDGELEHRDSTGAIGHLGPGDVQWMTAARGLVHEEFHAREAARRGGVVSMAQLWVNLPKADKRADPGYQDIRDADIPRVELARGAGVARVVAGSLNGARGPARTFSPMQVWDLRLKAGARLTLPLAEGDNALLPVFHGALTIDGRDVGAGKVALLSPQGVDIEIIAREDAMVLLLSGRPLDEPIEAHGPFVMNSRAEIQQAMADYRHGKMGVL